jgi:uncharacterized protein (TIGR02118 family)
MVLRDHVPLALRHHPTMRQYVVNIVDHVPRGEPDFDSVAELSFDTMADYRDRLYDSAEGANIVQEDVARFLAGADAYATTECVQKEGAPAPIGSRSARVKMICPIRRRTGMSHDDFVDHWLNRHGPLALRHHPGLIRYVANVVDAPLSPDAPHLDGIGELYFARPESLRDEMFDSPAGEAIIRRDIESFISHTSGYLVTEYLQKRS